ncbi:MAG: type II toxin-antitoxin system prevent-host-death family antitoxin [Microthrixaceae bacterium]|nr:type II toxin-antitoxin system prevent-host-death family antitoxin [Microthrixaceae bacterium]MCO5314098.1 type II toxin-antitoxin system prevent-host-death family antitoxin [Microthrixaceae bacterium]
MATQESEIPRLSQRELRNESGRVLREVGEGQSFILTNNGVPVGKLSPLDAPTPTLKIVRPSKRSGGWADLRIVRKQATQPLNVTIDEMREDRL